jgi:hypothetical protein
MYFLEFWINFINRFRAETSFCWRIKKKCLKSIELGRFYWRRWAKNLKFSHNYSQ